MGGAPVIETIRPGVGFTPEAAASFRRAEASWGSEIDVNSSFREYLKQLDMWDAWQDYIAGRGPHPGHGFALHPDKSMHCLGLAFDSDDHRKPGFVEHMAEHGWIRTALAIDELWHFDRQPWRDQHINDPAPASTGAEPLHVPEEDDMLYFTWTVREAPVYCIASIDDAEKITHAEAAAINEARGGKDRFAKVTLKQASTVLDGVRRRRARKQDADAVAVVERLDKMIAEIASEEATAGANA